MELRLPDRTRLPYSEVDATVKRYRRECPAVIDLFDLTNSGSHDDITKVDLLALNALNAFGRQSPMTPMTAMWQGRSLVEPTIRPITTTPIEHLTDSDIDEELPKMEAAINAIDAVHGFGDTATAKLFHRVRPNVGAIWDSRVEQWYGDSGGWQPWLRRVYADVRRPSNLQCLTTVQQSLDVRLPLLRIWDIILWQLKGE